MPADPVFREPVSFLFHTNYSPITTITRTAIPADTRALVTHPAPTIFWSRRAAFEAGGVCAFVWACTTLADRDILAPSKQVITLSRAAVAVAGTAHDQL